MVRKKKHLNYDAPWQKVQLYEVISANKPKERSYKIDKIIGKSYVTRVCSIEDRYWETDGKIETTANEIIVNIGQTDTADNDDLLEPRLSTSFLRD